ncbi:MAG TPA: DUF2837 family protein [Firmicutes bacterium]|nr:DUF2837 family protein [Bacillota bacterium]
MIDTLSYSVRLGGIRTRQLALALSLFNSIALISRTANMLQAPLVGRLVGANLSPERHAALAGSMRMVIASATAGTLLGIILIPTFLSLFIKAIKALARRGSIPAFLFECMAPAKLKSVPGSIRLPDRRILSRLKPEAIPIQLILLNVIITAIYTTGVLSAAYAAAIVPPSKSIAASLSSGLVNGIATVLFTILVDPKSAVITDQAMRGEIDISVADTLVAYLIGSKLAGTLLAQLIFIPATWVIAYFV